MGVCGNNKSKIGFNVVVENFKDLESLAGGGGPTPGLKSDESIVTWESITALPGPRGLDLKFWDQ